MSQTTTVSFEKLEVLAGDEPEFMIEILEMILEESPGIQLKMNALYESQDHDVLASTAHKFKSSVNVLGNPVMDKLLKDIENTASGKIDQGTEQLPDLMTSFQEVCDSILDQIQVKLNELKG